MSIHKRIIVCVLVAQLIFSFMPMVVNTVMTGETSAFEASAATLRVKSLWASKHEVGKVTFKWTKVSGASVSGWKLKYKTRKIGGNNKWSGWTTKTYGSGTMQATISVPKNYVIEIHAQAKGDSTWSQGIITTPAGGSYQAMKYAFVKNAATGKRISSKETGGKINLKEGYTISLVPDYEYPVKDYKKRPKLYPTQMLYDVADKSIISITNSKGEAYKGGMINGKAVIKAKKPGTTKLICRAPNGRKQEFTVTVSKVAKLPIYYPDSYVSKTVSSDAPTYIFNSSVETEDQKGNIIRLKDVLAGNGNKKIVLRGNIQFKERYKVGNNTEIDANGATIYSASNGDGCLTNEIRSGNYDAVKNVVIRGGTWKRKTGYHKKTMMFFVHGSNIRIENIYEECDYDGGHCIELVACKDVIIKNCELLMKGNCEKDNEDEPLQLDHANKITSPTIPTNLMNNNPCRNVQIAGCTLNGGRGLCSGHCGNDKTAQNFYHYSVVVQNNTITGQTAEALALYNVVGCEVSGNIIKTKTSDISSFRSDGMCIRIPEGSKAPVDMAKSTITIKKNTVYGGRSGIIVNSLSSSDFGYVTITDNKVFYKGDAKKAITVSKWYQNKSTEGCISSTITNNTTKKGW